MKVWQPGTWTTVLQILLVLAAVGVAGIGATQGDRLEHEISRKRMSDMDRELALAVGPPTIGSLLAGSWLLMVGVFLKNHRAKMLVFLINFLGAGCFALWMFATPYFERGDSAEGFRMGAWAVVVGVLGLITLLYRLNLDQPEQEEYQPSHVWFLATLCRANLFGLGVLFLGLGGGVGYYQLSPTPYFVVSKYDDLLMGVPLSLVAMALVLILGFRFNTLRVRANALFKFLLWTSLVCFFLSWFVFHHRGGLTAEELLWPWVLLSMVYVPLSIAFTYLAGLEEQRRKLTGEW